MSMAARDDNYERSEDFGTAVNVRCLENLLKAAQQQQLRQLKRFLQLKKQAETSVEIQRSWEHKEMAEEERRRRRQEELEAAKEERAQASAEVAARRAEAQLAAMQMMESNRQRILSKIDEAERRQALLALEKEELLEVRREREAAKEAARQDAYERSMAVLEERREQLQSKLDAVEERLKERDEIKIISERIKKEEQFLKELRRKEAAMKAEAEEEAVRQHFHHKTMVKEEHLQRRQHESEVVKQLKAQEWQQHWATIQKRVELAARESESKRTRLDQRLQEKLERAELLSQQKERLVEEMASIRRQMSRQEEMMRELMEKAHQGDTRALGSMDLAQLGLPLQDLVPSRTASADYSHRPKSASPKSSALESVPSRPQSARSSASKAAGARISKTPSTIASQLSTALRMSSEAQGAAAQNAPPTSYVDEASTHNITSSTSSRAASNVTLGPKERALLKILEEELRRESEREATLAKVADEKEVKRLTLLYGKQREAARQKILALQAPNSHPAFVA